MTRSIQEWTSNEVTEVVLVSILFFFWKDFPQYSVVSMDNYEKFMCKEIFLARNFTSCPTGSRPRFQGKTCEIFRPNSLLATEFKASNNYSEFSIKLIDRTSKRKVNDWIYRSIISQSQQNIPSQIFEFNNSRKFSMVYKFVKVTTHEIKTSQRL